MTLCRREFSVTVPVASGQPFRTNITTSLEMPKYTCSVLIVRHCFSLGTKSDQQHALCTRRGYNLYNGPRTCCRSKHFKYCAILVSCRRASTTRGTDYAHRRAVSARTRTIPVSTRLQPSSSDVSLDRNCLSCHQLPR